MKRAFYVINFKQSLALQDRICYNKKSAGAITLHKKMEA